MTIVAKANQIIIFQCQFRVFIVMLDMMYDLCFSQPSVSFAPLAHIAVAPEYHCSLVLPDFALQKFIFCHVIIKSSLICQGYNPGIIQMGSGICEVIPEGVQSTAQW